MRYYDMRAFYTVTQSRTILEQEIGNLYGYSAPMEALFIRPRCLVPSQVKASTHSYTLAQSYFWSRFTFKLQKYISYFLFLRHTIKGFLDLAKNCTRSCAVKILGHLKLNGYLNQTYLPIDTRTVLQLLPTNAPSGPLIDKAGMFICWMTRLAPYTPNICP